MLSSYLPRKASMSKYHLTIELKSLIPAAQRHHDDRNLYSEYTLEIETDSEMHIANVALDFFHSLIPIKNLQCFELKVVHENQYLDIDLTYIPGSVKAGGRVVDLSCPLREKTEVLDAMKTWKF